jgi:hypothetical protein
VCVCVCVSKREFILLFVGHGFDSLDSLVIRADGLPHLPSMEHGEVFRGFSSSTFPWKLVNNMCCLLGGHMFKSRGG